MYHIIVAKIGSYNVKLFLILLFCCILSAEAYMPHLRIVRLQGTDKGNQHSVIEALPAASLLQTPGARADATTWCDESGHVWLFGGEGFDDDTSSMQPKLLNDLWLFNTSRLEWNIIHGNHSMQYTSLANYVENPKLFEDKMYRNSTNVFPMPRKRATSCGVLGIVFVVFGGIDSMGNSLSDTWIYLIQKARWLPLSRNITESAHPPVVWSTKASWCHLDALYVVGSSTNNDTEMWKFSLRTMEWTNETMLSINQQHCAYSPLPVLQPANANSVTVVWNGTFYNYWWQINHSDSNFLTLSVALQSWQLLPFIEFLHDWYFVPFMWLDLNSPSVNDIACRSPSIFQQSAGNSQSCNLHRCYKIMSSTQWPVEKLHSSSWFYQGNMYIFGGQAGDGDDSRVFFNDLCILQLSDSDKFNAHTNYMVLTLSLISAVVAIILLGLSIFCIVRYYDYRYGRKKSRELRIRYMPLIDQNLYE